MIIKDNVHGEIKISDKFVRLINTKEFQRLRRIKQLATADQVFPGATHSRFAHSIGVYYVMSKIVEHFEEALRLIGYEYEIDETERDAILAAALLHDIGHGPFSHAFENARIFSKEKHEEWTKKIISDENTEIYKVLMSWSNNMPEKVNSYIDYRKVAKRDQKGYDELVNVNHLDLKFIFASLVSSQLDADRMDYLLRDSLACGVKFGQFDMDNLIEGLSVAVDAHGQLRVCVKKNHLANVEEYFYARYQMYRNVYFHPYKVLSEKLLQVILKMASELYIDAKLSANMIPPLIRDLFEQSEMSLTDFIKLDDTVVVGAIHTWADLKDEKTIVLSMLCNNFLYRYGYRRIAIVNKECLDREIDIYLEELKLDDKEKKLELILIECENKASMYDTSKVKPVYILGCAGDISDLSSHSGLVGDRREEKHLYYSSDMAEHYLGSEKTKKFYEILNHNSVTNNIEIEKKYVFPKECNTGNFGGYIDKICDKIEKYRYIVQKEEKPIEQEDVYFDTKDKILLSERYTLRIREREGNYIVTCKTPRVSDSNGEGGQLERGEGERRIKTPDIREEESFIKTCLEPLFSEREIKFDDLIKTKKITNKRYKIVVTKGEMNSAIHKEKYEIVFDDVTYTDLEKTNGKNTRSECQMEIELKSDVETRVNMLLLTEKIEGDFPELQRISDSKYQRAYENTINTQACEDVASSCRCE